MGKTTGFMEYRRREPGERPPEERIKDWQEFKLPPRPEEIKIQAARCMECGVPFCHSGLILKGMVSGCPLNNLIPEWNDLIYRGCWQQALKRLLKTNNFPEFTGRVCPAPCEGACTLGMNEQAVTIKNNEYYLAEMGFEKGWMGPFSPAKRTDFRVAVVGSGPAGLACADQLNKAGHRVTVFEREKLVGGLLRYGIPNMKLDKSRVLNRRIELMEREGVKFITNCEVGVDITAAELREKYAATVLCAGATRPRDLRVPGRNLAGIHLALDYLRVVNTDLEEKNIDAGGLDVVVIGGGDTGTDCVAAAVRQGCRSIRQLEIMPAPPRRRKKDNPWPEWPRIFKQDYGQREALAVFGRDPRVYRVLTEGFAGDDRDRIQGVRTVRVKWETDNGDYKPVKISGTGEIIKAQLVILALGFLGPEKTLPLHFGINIENINGNNSYTADIAPGLFIAGDMRQGPGLVVQAIKEGREVADRVHQYLTGG